MARPLIVRADTIDLQDHQTPSASDHTSARLAPSLAPHQAETLREVAQETAVEEARSPHLSWNGDNPDLHQYAEDLAAGVSQTLTGSAMQAKEQEDALAIAQNGGVSSSDEGDIDGDGDVDLDDDMMDRISSSPSIEDEDIDFEFVYALRTFVATVEGQANVTKGDILVLLDDSNCYWWLVRVVKDSSIGYLPAERIETPTERLARLNKHRNVDLCATMLGDQAVKPRNPFIPGIRRKRKTVVFTEPTYVNYPIVDYSSEEEDIDELFGKDPMTAQEQVDQQKAETEQKQQDQQQGQAQVQSQSQEQAQKGKQEQEPAQEPSKAQQEPVVVVDLASDDEIKIQPLKPRVKKEVKVAEPLKEETAEELEQENQEPEEIAVDARLEAPSKSRNGNIRNTDSFFKDETAETKKITLTPNLLRDENTPRPVDDGINRDLKSRTSLDKMEKEFMSDKERRKIKEKEKREKDKKPSAIRSFFSRKDKKKSNEEDDDSIGKRSVDMVSEPRESEDPLALEQAQNSTPQKAGGKLHKPQPRTEPSPTRKGSTGPAVGKPVDYSNAAAASMRLVEETSQTRDVSSPAPALRSREVSRDRSVGTLTPQQAPISTKPVARSAVAGPDPRVQQAMQAKVRMDLDMSDDDDDIELVEREVDVKANGAYMAPRPAPTPAGMDLSERQVRPQLAGAPDSQQTVSTISSDKTITPLQVQLDTTERLSESPVEVSPISPADRTKLPGLVVDSSSQETISPEMSPSPELLDQTSRDETPSSSSKEHYWDDSKLRAFFDEGEHVRDLLVVVYDKTNVAPAGDDHPVAGSLFREQNAKLAQITTQLDNMLGDWLARKQRLRGTV